MSKASKHIGIVACSAEGGALAYRTICLEGAEVMGQHDHPEVTMHTHSLAQYVKHLNRGDWQAVAALMLSSARKLAAAGADFVICPDNTVHAAMAEVRGHSPLPWLHIAEVVGAEANRRAFKRVGVMGTRWLVDGSVYPETLGARGIDVVRPASSEREEINSIILDELVCGVFKPESTSVFQRIIQRFKTDGCDAVVLGCTEIPLIINDGNSALPTLDSTRLLARAALRHATE